jgi:hypothetical protein
MEGQQPAFLVTKAMYVLYGTEEDSVPEGKQT